MKKIVVFTDFSERAEQAAAYAWHLAHEVQANIVLFHAYLNPSNQAYAAQVAWPLMNTGQLEISTRKELALLASKMSKIEFLSGGHGFVPKIETQCEEGELDHNIKAFASDKEVILFVMANHRKGFSSLITGNHMSKMLEHATVPVLIIPGGKTYKHVRKIAFATDLNFDDIHILHSLAGLARHFNASIMLANISPMSEGEQRKEQRDQVQQFLCEVSNKVNFPQVYYRHIEQRDVSAGLKWATENIPFDMLVMVHRQRNFLERLFSSSYTKAFAEQVDIPMLVFPSPATHYPVF